MRRVSIALLSLALLGTAVACGAESTRHLGAGVLDPRAAEEHRDRRLEQLHSNIVQK